MRLIMSGLDYNLAPISLREPLSFTRTQAGEVLRRIQRENDGVSGCVLISTCNRTELYLTTEFDAELRPDELLCRAVHLDYEPFADAFVTRRGGEAARHLMEVAGGLKSLIWGEDQIVTQVKAAILLAREMRTADPVLETLFRNAVSAGKEMKTRVRLRGVSTSAAARAVNVLKDRAGDLSGLRVLVIGNGEMGRLAAKLLRDEGCEVSVTLRTYRHGETIVPPGCGVVPYDDRI
ncbi:MAG: glutamyl-tRNA reductase, partial [Clostridia bacterium]|nr:glutamyl-tRNA reductase [Clostridia bacterium]